ncbi:DsbA family protein [Terrihabitans rhizophilus]|uniref:DsbA family protein n=1 Tax=Terrihabitans rhizophilus TaxID=3092662 RepID=A0ABU4RKQ0_9HYPH|nr:DsbA family protein [Terrihabitans sp. PJ23]MDX6805424.1 DsbA family protein [Terrihabitans sp. PJ23]
MSIRRIVIAALVVVAGLGLFLLPRYLRAETPAGATAQAASPSDRAGIESVVRDYLLSNPEILREMMARLQQKDQVAANEQRGSVFEEYRDTIYNSPKQVVLGNPEGDVTLVEFFDYNCGYCRKALADAEQLLKEDGKLRIVLKEFPVLGEESRDAARVAVAVHAQAPDKYLDFHRALMTAEGGATGAGALEVAKSLGLDMDRISADLTGPEVDEPMLEAHQLAGKLGIDGTPTYVIADTVVAGAVGAETLKGIISNVRTCGKASCS